MINFSGISNKSIIGKIIRLPIYLIPSSSILPILQGNLKGKKWIVGSSTRGCWLGSYEFEKQNLISKYIKKSDVVYDIGANVGFYTLLSSLIVGKEGKVCSFEPLPQNLEYLKKHIEINNINNVSVFGVAISNKNIEQKFNFGSNRSMGFLSNEGDIVVESPSLDRLFEEQKIPIPNLIKMDIEGGEFDALLGAKKILINYHPTIFLATHGNDIHKKCCSLLIDLGYNLKPIGKENIENADEIIAEYLR